MKKILLTALIAFSVEQGFAACNSKNDLKGTWDYYQAVAYAPSKSNISNCEGAFMPDTKAAGSFTGWCYISPGKGPRIVNMQGTYTVTDPATCAVEVKMDMGAMGISTFVFHVNSSKNGWAGMWTNKGGDYGVSNGVKISKSTATPLTPADFPLP